MGTWLKTSNDQNSFQPNFPHNCMGGGAAVCLEGRSQCLSFNRGFPFCLPSPVHSDLCTNNKRNECLIAWIEHGSATCFPTVNTRRPIAPTWSMVLPKGQVQDGTSDSLNKQTGPPGQRPLHRKINPALSDNRASLGPFTLKRDLPVHGLTMRHHGGRAGPVWSP